MRKTILLAVIACIFGIVLLAGLAFYIPNRLGQTEGEKQSEIFTGFAVSAEDPVGMRSASGGKENNSSIGSNATGGSTTGHADTGQTYPNDTMPASSGTRTETVPASPGGQAEKNIKTDGSGTEDSETAESETEGFRADSEALPTRRITQASAFAALSDHTKAHRIIWVGDSRTLGLQDALEKTGREDDDLFVGQVGEGVRWFREEGIYALSDAILANPDLPVVLNFGVNDPDLVDEYVVAYWDLIRANPDTRFYLLSVNPLDEEFLMEDGKVNEAVFDTVNNLNVARMNVKLKDEFGSRYIDSASFLKSDGFDTVDGLHFTRETYLKIHDFVVDALF